MKLQDLITACPRAYHVTSAPWSVIEAHGLWSTEGLVDRFEVDEPARSEILEQVRESEVTLEHPKHGTVVIRDQRSMQATKLKTVLQDMTVAEWCRVLNRRVFFWVERDKALGLRNAKQYKDRAQTILVLDTARLVQQHLPRIDLCPINSGSTLYDTPHRGRDTFLRIEDYPFGKLKRKRKSAARAIRELTVLHRVPDVRDLVIEVLRMSSSGEVSSVALA